LESRPIRGFRWESASLPISGGKKDPAFLAPKTANVILDGVFVVSAEPLKGEGGTGCRRGEKMVFLEGRRK
jgi:hypothetical protein